VTEPALVSLAEVQAAAQRLKGVVTHTPLLPSALLSGELDAEVRLKCESLQRTGSFKARGANNFVLQLSDAALESGVITYSSGNHAQAVAYAARQRGVRAVVVMPTTAPRVKREGARALGAEIVVEGTTSLHRQARAEAMAQEEGLVVVPPFDHPWIIAGQGTAGLEVAQAWADMDTFVVCVGGGGLVSGCAAALRRLRGDEVRIVGVEPEGAASMRAALDAGEPVELDAIDTLADGLAPVRAGELTYHHIRELADDVVTVPDEAIREATRFLVSRQKLVVEYSGAAAVAAIRSGRVETRGRKVCAVLTGGNLDPSILRELVAA
jgi:threonine dehydratase